MQRNILGLVLPGLEVLNRARKDGHEFGTFVEEGQSDQQQRSLVVKVPNIVEKQRQSFFLDFSLLDILAVLLLDLLFELLDCECLSVKKIRSLS